jgi:hypothetical protein
MVGLAAILKREGWAIRNHMEMVVSFGEGSKSASS